jgi:hypothetical protein
MRLTGEPVDAVATGLGLPSDVVEDVLRVSAKNDMESEPGARRALDAMVSGTDISA